MKFPRIRNAEGMRNRFIHAWCCFENAIGARIFVDENSEPHVELVERFEISPSGRTNKRPSLGSSKARAGQEWLKPGAWGCKTIGAASQSAEVFALPLPVSPTRRYAVAPYLLFTTGNSTKLSPASKTLMEAFW